jgi:hypothetical protein
MTLRRTVALVGLLASCDRRPPQRSPSETSASHAAPVIALVDSVVVVRHGSEVDTVPNILTSALPAMVGDTALLGVALDSTGRNRIYRYSISSRRVYCPDLPADLMPGLTGIGISPDGRAAAYVRVTGDQSGVGVVRSWPAGKVLALTPPLSASAGDVVGGLARWRDAQHYEIFVQSTGYGWLRFHGGLNERGFVVDTLGPTLPGH